MSEPALRPATVEDLYRTEGKAELVGGRLKIMEPHWIRTRPRQLEDLRLPCGSTSAELAPGTPCRRTSRFLVDLPNRQSFSPDGAYFIGPDSGMKFPEGAPVLAIEVRSEGDYGLRAEREMAAKRAEYFAAGTLVVWDVDLVGADTGTGLPRQ